MSGRPVFGERPWLFGPWTDVAAFGGSALLSMLLLAVGHALGILEGDAPGWVFLLAVVGVDVAHVWSTLFRTYLDPDERARHPLRYALVPLACLAVGVGLHATSAALFWRALAYFAVFHFVRQQAGWVTLYRHRNGEREAIDRWIDQAAIYSATVYPLLDWHARLPLAFDWFVPGDFVDVLVGLPVRRLVGLPILAFAIFGLRQLHRARSGLRVSLGKLLVVTSTALTWFVGIVVLESDYAFTVTNVLGHGIPYLVLTHRYGRAIGRPAGSGARPLLVFAATCIGLALLEEGLWDRLVWHDHPDLFGASGEVEGELLAFLVPLLALPQITHYVLDGLVWRRDASPVLAEGLGGAEATGVVSSVVRTPEPARRAG